MHALAADVVRSNVRLNHEAIFAGRPEQTRIVAGGGQFLDPLPMTLADHQMAMRAQIVQNQFRIGGRGDQQVFVVEFQKFGCKNVSCMVRMKLTDFLLFERIPENHVAVVADRTKQRALVIELDAVDTSFMPLLIGENSAVSRVVN